MRPGGRSASSAVMPASRPWSPAPLLRSRRRPHPDRWPRHLAGHAKPARADLWRRRIRRSCIARCENTLRPAERARPRSSPPARTPGFIHAGLARAARLRRRWASAASSSRAASASASRRAVSSRCADPGARRGHLRARQRDRGKAIQESDTDGGQERDRDRAPAHHQSAWIAWCAHRRPHRRQGTHEQLLRANGHYAALWHRQSGGLLMRDAGGG